MSDVQSVTCFRYPCDTAYHRGTHQPREDGSVLHEVAWGYESRKGGVDDAHDFPRVWAVSAIAWDEHPWQPWIHLENGQRSFENGKEAAYFIEKFTTAMACALDANLKEAHERAEAAEQMLEECEVDRHCRSES